MPGGVGDIWDRDVGILVLALVHLQVRENLLRSWVDIDITVVCWTSEPPTPSGTTLPDRNHPMLTSLISNVVIDGMASHTLTSSLRSASFSSSTALSTTRPTTTLTTACPGLIN